MNTKKFEIYMFDGENIITYLVTSSDLTTLEEKIKKYSSEDIVTFHSRGSYMLSRTYLRKNALRFHDEIVEAEYESKPIDSGKFGSPVDMTMVAHVKNYPILWHILFDNPVGGYFQELKKYLNNESGLNHRIGKKPKYLSELYKILHEEDGKEVNYDSDIPNEEKIKLINVFLSSLTFQQLKVEPVSSINNQIENINSVMKITKTNELIRSIEILKLKIILAKENAESIDFLNNKLNGENILIRKIRI